ncbi:MAG TPA: HAMP domain-containing sensor histidine kinase [Ktedonobacterales bacterium]
MKPVITLSARSQEASSPARSYRALARFLWRDPYLLSAFLFVALIACYQAVIHLLRVPWIHSANDWLLAVLAWPELFGVVLLSWWLSRTRRPGALSWWLLSAALLCYTISQMIWLVGDEIFSDLNHPFPWWSDLFFLLQAPFWYLALLLLPSARPFVHPRLARLRVFLDSLLLMLAATLLSWYFVFVPLSLQSGQSVVGKVTALTYAVVDLGILFILIVLFLGARRSLVAHAVLGLLIVAVILVMIGDLWYAVLNQAQHHASNDPPDIFWMLGYLLVPLAGLVQFRLTRRTPVPHGGRSAARPLHWEDALECLRFFSPFMVALLASVVLMVRAIQAPNVGGTPFLSWLVSLGLLALVITRQGVVYLDNARLRRERDEANMKERAASEAARQMEAFLGIACHELKTPLTTLTLHHQLIERRLRSAQTRKKLQAGEAPELLLQLGERHAVAQTQLARLNLLVNDLLDVTQIQEGQLKIRRAPADLTAVVSAAVEEQRQLAPERMICLHLPAEEAVSVSADASRVGQVVTNYLTNALKYSPEEYSVEAGVQTRDQQGYVWVRDQGPEIPLAEQARVWERFYRVPGIEIQSGSGIGLGLGLYISRTIIEHHHGQVGVQSLPGQGTTFWFSLPLLLLD